MKTPNALWKKRRGKFGMIIEFSMIKTDFPEDKVQKEGFQTSPKITPLEQNLSANKGTRL